MPIRPIGSRLINQGRDRDDTQDFYPGMGPSFMPDAIPTQWEEQEDGTWLYIPNNSEWTDDGVRVVSPWQPAIDQPSDTPAQTIIDRLREAMPNKPDPITETPVDNTPTPGTPPVQDIYDQLKKAKPETNFIPGVGPLPSPTGVAPARFNMPDFNTFANPPQGSGPFPGMNTPGPGQISGPARDFTPFGEPMGQFSAPRSYGGLPRSTGPWGVPGAWYDGQFAQANALRGS
mgnify:CR=1 FL=1